MTDSTNSGRTLIRGIGGIGVALIAVNSMIGAGIFTTPPTVAIEAENLSHWLYLGIGLLFITVVLTFAELASHFKESGGPILYAQTAFGPLAGFVTGWTLYLSRMTAFAANTTAMAIYLGAFLPWVTTGVGRTTLIFVVVAALTGVNYVGVKNGVRTIAFFTIFKLTPLVLITLIGLKEVTGDTLLPSALPDIEDFGGMTLLIIYAFVGFEAATIVSGETQKPRRTMPRAIISTIAFTAVLYFLVVLVYVSVIPPADRPGTTLVDVGRALAGDWGGIVLGLAAVFSIGGNLAANMLSVPRVTYALGEQHMLPGWFSKIHERYATPSNSVLLLGVLGLAFALSGTFVFLAIASSLLRLIGYTLCILAFPIIRQRFANSDNEDAFRLKGGYTIPLIALTLCLWLGSQASREAWQVTATLVALGLCLYWFAGRKRMQIQ